MRGQEVLYKNATEFRLLEYFRNGEMKFRNYSLLRETQEGSFP